MRAPTWCSWAPTPAAWAEVVAEPGWVDVPPNGNAGVLSEPTWFRVDLVSEASRTVLVRLNEFSPREVTLVHVVDGRAAHSRTARADEPSSARDVADPSFIFRLQLPEGDSTLLLRMVSHEPVQLRLTAESEEHLATTLGRQHMAWTAYIGLIGGLALYNFFLWLTLRDRVYLLYVGMAVFTHGLTILHMAGMTYVFLPGVPPATLAPWGMAFYGLGGFVAAAFAWQYLQIPRFGPWSRPFYYLFAAGCIVLIAVSLATGGGGYQIAIATLGTAPLLLIGSGIEALWRGHKPARWFLVAWAVLCASAAYSALSSVGIAPLIGFQGGLMGVGAAAEGTLLSFALADGIRRLRAERRAARRKAEHAQRDMLEAQLSAQKQKGAFLSMMSHELRTPLSQVLGITQLLELTEEDDDRREQLILVRRGGTDLLTMIDDMLLFTALREGRGLGLVADCSLDQVVDALDRYRAIAADRGTGFLVHGGSERVAVDLFLVQRAIAHLVDNAVKHTTSGQIEVRACTDGEHLTVEIRDEGPGIPDGKLDALLSLFSQDQRGMTRSTAGIGLGLSMCRTIAEALDGTLELLPRPSGGTCARLVVPVSAREYGNVGVGASEGANDRIVA